MGLKLLFENASGARPMGYWPVSLPYEDAQALGEVIVFNSSKGRTLGHKVRDIGKHSTIYDVWLPFLGNEKVLGEVSKAPATEPTHDFMLHPWVGDDIKAVIPNVVLQLNQNNVGNFTGRYSIPETPQGIPMMDEIKLVRQTKTRQVWYARGRPRKEGGTQLSGFVCHFWITFKSMSPVADFRMGMIWSDPMNPEPDLYVDAAYLRTGEAVKFDFTIRNGHAHPPAFDGQRWWSPIVTGTTDFNAESPGTLGFIEGCGLPLVGRMLCVPQANPSAMLPVDYDLESPEYMQDRNEQADWINDSLELLRAGFGEPIYGVVTDRGWDGKFLSHKNIGRMRPDPDYRSIPKTIQQLLGILEDPSPVSFYHTRPIGCTLSPGQTGGQEDFGATKGLYATAFSEPRWLYYGLYGVVADYHRGFMYHEPDGKPIDPDAHPNWTTWSMVTHYHHGQSPDRRGKRDVGYNEGRANNHFQTYDDQHRSQNNLAAVYALTGDEILEFIIDMCSRVDAAHVRVRNNFGYGAPRACGRRALTWSHFLLLTEQGSKANLIYRDLLKWNLDKLPEFFEGDHNNGDVDILYPGRDPRYGMQNPSVPGVDLYNWVAWEHGLMAIGLLAAYRVTGWAGYLTYAQRVAKTIVKYAFFKANDTWYFCDNVFYPNVNPYYDVSTMIPGWTPDDVGKPLPENLYYPGSWAVKEDQGGGVGYWTFQGVLVYAATHAPHDPDWNKAMEIVQFVTDGKEGGSVSQAEWQATVNSIVGILSQG